MTGIDPLPSFVWLSVSVLASDFSLMVNVSPFVFKTVVLAGTDRQRGWD
jgi:hypothetical protein